MLSYTVQEINEHLNGQLTGNCTSSITGPEQLEKAKKTNITFIGSQKYVKLGDKSRAGAAVVSDSVSIEEGQGRAVIKVKNADLAMAKILNLFNTDPPVFEEDIHPAAILHPTVELGKNCRIGANCYIGKNVKIGDGVVIYPNVTIFDDTILGDYSIIWSGTVIRERSIIGKSCILHSNVSIGADGFGYRPSQDGQGLVKIPQIGNVVIGDGVEIGANSTIDRGKFSSTVIGDGCKIDNLVQIGHNSVMGRYCIMAGSSGLAGSVTLGDGVIIGGSASIKDHVTIHSGARVGGGSGVMSDVGAGKSVLGYPATESRDMLKQWAALRNLVKRQ